MIGIETETKVFFSLRPQRPLRLSFSTALLEFIETIERTLGKNAVKNFLPMQPGDVPATYADIEDLTRDVGFAPTTPIEAGIKRFVEWYRVYYGI